jgi:hypothetical protein
LLGEALGDKSPAEYRALAAKLRDSGVTEEKIESLRDEFSAMREQHQAFVQAQEMAQHRAVYERGLTTYVDGAIESTSPHAARAIRADREGAMGEIWDIIRKDATTKLEAGAGEPMTPEEAVKVFDSRLSRMRTWLGGTTPDATAAVKTLANTVSGAHLSSATKDMDPVAQLEREAWDWFNKLERP